MEVENIVIAVGYDLSELDTNCKCMQKELNTQLSIRTRHQ